MRLPSWPPRRCRALRLLLANMLPCSSYCLVSFDLFLWCFGGFSECFGGVLECFVFSCVVLIVLAGFGTFGFLLAGFKIFWRVFGMFWFAFICFDYVLASYWKFRSLLTGFLVFWHLFRMFWSVLAGCKLFCRVLGMFWLVLICFYDVLAGFRNILSGFWNVWIPFGGF